MPALQRAGREIIIRKQEIVDGVFHTLFMELQQRISVGADPVSMGTGQRLPLLGRQDGVLMLVWKKHLSILRLMLAATTGLLATATRTKHHWQRSSRSWQKGPWFVHEASSR